MHDLAIIANRIVLAEERHNSVFQPQHLLQKIHGQKGGMSQIPPNIPAAPSINKNLIMQTFNNQLKLLTTVDNTSDKKTLDTLDAAKNDNPTPKTTKKSNSDITGIEKLVFAKRAASKLTTKMLRDLALANTYNGVEANAEDDKASSKVHERSDDGNSSCS